MYASLNSAKEAKAKTWNRVKNIREKIKNEKLGGNKSSLEVELIRAKDKHNEAIKAENEAKKAIEKRAIEMGKTAKPKFKKGDTAKITKFYADTPVGTTGEVIKVWSEPNKKYHWAKLYFGKNKSGQRLQKSYPVDVLEKVENMETKQEKTNNIKAFEMDRIFTDESRFQNREGLDQERVDDIINDFNINLLDPVVIWKDPKDGRHYLLSGHHRYAAVKQMERKGIPARIFEGTEQQAIDFALDSNTLGKAETPLERAKRYRDLREKGKSDKEIKEQARKAEGKNANFIINLSYLYPTGKAMESLKQFSKSGDRQTLNYLEPIADWVGEIRKMYPETTKAHENEMFSYLMTMYSGSKQKGKISNKAEWKQLASAVIERAKKHGYFDDPTRVLNFQFSTGKDSYEKEYDQRLSELKKDVEEAQKELDEKRKQLLMDENTTQDDFNRVLQKYQNKLIAAERKLLEHRNQKENVKKASQAQTDIFSQAAAIEQETQKLKDNKQSKAKTESNIAGIIRKLLADRDNNTLKQTELMNLALAIHTKRPFQSQLIDESRVNSRRLAISPNNIIRWAIDPGRYDLLGVDCPEAKSATVSAKEVSREKVVRVFNL